MGLRESIISIKLIQQMEILAKKTFGDNYAYQDGMRTFKDHYHIHLVFPISNAKGKYQIKT